MKLRQMLVVAMVAAAPAAAAQAPQAATERPEAFDALVRCRAIADDAARLRCFDATAANLQQAADSRELVVVDRAQIRESRRRLFGLELPRLPVFGGGDDREEEEIRSIEGTIRSARQADYGRWLVTLEDGSVWMQTDNAMIAGRPRAGQKVQVNRGALGSYMMRVNGQPGVRVRRQL